MNILHECKITFPLPRGNLYWPHVRVKDPKLKMLIMCQ